MAGTARRMRLPGVMDVVRPPADSERSIGEVGPSSASMPLHVGQKMHSIAELFARGERRVGRHQLAIESVTERVGRPGTAYVLAFVFVAWMLANGLAPALGLRAPDPPPFAWLQVAACVAALLMTVAILTTQNRVGKLAQHRARLDLQVNLIAEEKIAKIVSLLEELRRDLPSVKNRTDSLADAMTAAVDLDAVAGELEAPAETVPYETQTGRHHDHRGS
jgi:uncharacterized membrane protein